MGGPIISGIGLSGSDGEDNFEHYAKELFLLYQGSSPAKGHGKGLKKVHFQRVVTC